MLHTPEGEARKAWEIARGKKTWERRPIPARGRVRDTGVLALPVRHPEYPGPLWLVVSRPGSGRAPWYLLTSEPVHTVEDAWKVVLAYARRWQIVSELSLQ